MSCVGEVAYVLVPCLLRLQALFSISLDLFSVGVKVEEVALDEVGGVDVNLEVVMLLKVIVGGLDARETLVEDDVAVHVVITG